MIERTALCREYTRDPPVAPFTPPPSRVRPLNVGHVARRPNAGPERLSRPPRNGEWQPDAGRAPTTARFGGDPGGGGAATRLHEAYQNVPLPCVSLAPGVTVATCSRCRGMAATSGSGAASGRARESPRRGHARSQKRHAPVSLTAASGAASVLGLLAPPARRAS